MTRLLMLTRAARAVEVLPALDLLTHEVRVAQPRAALVPAHPDVEAVLLDATAALADARTVARDVSTLCPQVPVLAVLTEGALTAVGPEWSLADVVLASAGPAEVDARIRLLRVPGAGPGPAPDDRPLTAGGLEVDAAGYRARVDGRSLNLTFREFELLKHLVQSPGRVFTREQLLQEVWGYDYFGGTRTVDVHVRRLRAKLGADHEQLIVTVRNVGYRFAPRGDAGEAADAPGRLHAVEDRHLDVHEADIGAALARQPDCFVSVARLPHDLDVGHAGQQVGEAAPHDLVVVEQEHGDAHVRAFRR